MFLRFHDEVPMENPRKSHALAPLARRPKAQHLIDAQHEAHGQRPQDTVQDVGGKTVDFMGIETVKMVVFNGFNKVLIVIWWDFMGIWWWLNGTW